MLNKIKEYYQEAGISPLLLKKKIAKLEKHPDIAEEFALWIDTQTFKKTDCVIVNDYSAKRLSQMSTFLCGEGAFMLLIELRENPEQANKRISEGFFLK